MRTLAYITTLVAASFIATTASASPESDGLSLETTLRALFQSSPGFNAYAVQAKGAEAARLRAAGAFDLAGTASVQGQRSLWTAQFGAMTDQGYTDLSAQVGVGARTRENVSLQVAGAVPFASNVDPAISPDQPQLTGSLVVPLLKFGRSAPFAAEEQYALLHELATQAVQQDSESELAERVAEGYWRWVGAFEQLKVARRLEALAEDQLKDVDLLIAQHARASVDRLPFTAAVENATASRVQAEQAMLEQRQLVWEAVGLAVPPGSASPSGELPAVPADSVDAASISRRAHEVAAGRPILQAFNDEAKAASAREDGARVARRPDLNLLAQATALRVQRVQNNVALTQDDLGYYGMVGLQFAFPIQNRTARGALEQAAAAREAVALNASQRRNAIDVRIDAMSSALATLAHTHQGRIRAVDDFQQSYEAERTKFRLGTATGMEVVIAEQQYMSASLAVVADRTSYAIALARLLHEAGVLNAPVQSRDPAAVVRCLSILKM